MIHDSVLPPVGIRLATINSSNALTERISGVVFLVCFLPFQSDEGDHAGPSLVAFGICQRRPLSKMEEQKALTGSKKFSWTEHEYTWTKLFVLVAHEFTPFSSTRSFESLVGSVYKPVKLVVAAIKIL